MALLPIIDVLGKIVDNVIPDPDKKLEVKLELAKLADAEAARDSQERIAQTEVNKVEAGSSLFFVAGWRPAAGWMCVAAFGYTLILAPLLSLPTAAQAGIDDSLLRDVLLGMLGISYLGRTAEKVKGIAENTLAGPQPIDSLPAPKEKKGGVFKKIGRGEWPF